MLTTKERNQMIAKIRGLPSSVEATVKNLNDEQLDTPYRDGGWTVRQVVHDLSDSHMNAFVRAKLMLTEEKPTLKPYDQEKWAVLKDTIGIPIQSSLSILRGVHERWTVLFETLSESSWSRLAFHPEIGDITVEDLLTTYARHGENHVGQITKLKAAKGW